MDDPSKSRNEAAAESAAEGGRPETADSASGGRESDRPTVRSTSDRAAGTGGTGGTGGAKRRAAGRSARAPADKRASAGHAEAAAPSAGASATDAPSGTSSGGSSGGSTGGRPPSGANADEQGAALFSAEDAQLLRERWRSAQSDFVDDPRTAVDTADRLVGETLRTLNERLAAHKEVLEGRWSGEAESDTEELRTTMRDYRAFFRQLLQTGD
ncbi:hypothetical protein [Streptomonospora salina]|uniref:Uncharacterized protein n=1 Tax=Streptomonospora salina TaxID=104205 RepID=A0A841EB25_9ACTN|nr:hypothetical protein [Streptomonospora salina]MBB5998263.1 hypothetical protein [Streptomonospora salina]